MKPLTRRQTIVALLKLGWRRRTKSLWSTDKRGLKRLTAHGVTLREAASLEWLETERL